MSDNFDFDADWDAALEDLDAIDWDAADTSNLLHGPKHQKLSELLKSSIGLLQSQKISPEAFISGQWHIASHAGTLGVLKVTCGYDKNDVLTATKSLAGKGYCCIVLATSSGTGVLKAGEVQSDGSVFWSTSGDVFYMLGDLVHEQTNSDEIIVAVLLRKSRPIHIDDRIAGILSSCLECQSIIAI